MTRFHRYTCLLLISLAAHLAACGIESSPLRDKVAEAKIISMLEQAKRQTPDTQAVSIEEIIGSSTGRLCIQSPYMTKADFEKVTGVSAPHFRSINDDIYVWWLLRDPNDVKIAIVPRASVMDRKADAAAACGVAGVHQVWITPAGTTGTYEIRSK